MSSKDESPPATRTEGETLDLPEGMRGFAQGQILGERYQIVDLLGRGGMGEVWHAFDLKLRVEVALKALRPEFFKSDRRLELLRQEVRAAREVMSPTVCRIFDLVEVEGRELVSMEYVDGATLLGVLQERGPLELKEAQDIASQFLAGLEAIHKAGLIHRDIKPENIMLTRAGRVVVMDFGLARQETEGGGTVAGTPAYMAPEQAAGQTLDARADVYAAGVVLAEMVSPDGIKSFDSRQSLWEGVRSEPAKIPDSPWAPVIQKAVKKDREGRFNSAHTLTRALEDVTLRFEGADDLHPYPGLASFTEADAEYFFGREAEVEQMWRKLEGPARLLAIAGPSGAGKTSFLRAGVAPSCPPGWALVRCTPGTAPINALAEAYSEETANYPDGVKMLLRFHEPEIAVQIVSRWRRRHDHGVLIVDQFEELFTLNPAEVQRQVADLLERLVLEADTLVLVSLRDDFLFRCHQVEALRPALADLTMLGPPEGAALRRAIVQPAQKCGYRFEDDALVDEMLAEVEGERGALPLLAFAAARLWERRDRETGLLTREAYHEIGGVGGALAQHAEATIDRIGVERIPIVRELFRNLVTAEGTRAVRDWDELLSIFEKGDNREGINPSPTMLSAPVKGVGAGFIPARNSAEEVLRELIDARLLTSYEIHEDEHEPTRRVEIIHESLLANWPRLVRWQTQDADSVQLRDQLRQAARTWDERGRSDDMLWTGSSYREYASWREHYPGGLSNVEEDFGNAMTSLAGRRRRRRRIVVAAGFAILLAGLAIVGSFWQRSVRETRRAEAQKLIAMGQVRLEDDPTAALAHATKSLELADSEEARFLALKALWEGPTAFVVNETPAFYANFSPDGSWLVQTNDFMSSVSVISRYGRQRSMDLPTESGKSRARATFGGWENVFFSKGGFEDKGHMALWSAPDGRLLWSTNLVDDPPDYTLFATTGSGPEDGHALLVMVKGTLITVDAVRPGNGDERLAEIRMKYPFSEGGYPCTPRATGKWLGLVEGNDISIVRVGDHGLSDRVLLGRQEGDLFPSCEADPQERFLLTATRTGEFRLWDVTGNQAPRIFDFQEDLSDIWFSREGSYLIAVTTPDQKGANFEILSIDDSGLHHLRHMPNVGESFPGVDLDPVGLWLARKGPSPAWMLWSLAAPAGAEPLLLRRGPRNYAHSVNFSPDGRWLATSDQNGLTMWPLGRPYPAVIQLSKAPLGLNFGPDGRFLATAAYSDVRVWPLEGPVPSRGHVVLEADGGSTDVAVSPNGELFGVSSIHQQPVRLVSDGEQPRHLEGAEELGPGSDAVSFSPDGRFLAAVTEGYNAKTTAYRVWEVATGDEVAVLRLDGEYFQGGSRFTSDGRLLTGTTKGVVAWNVETGEHEALVEVAIQEFSASENGRRFLVTEEGEAGGMQDPAGSPSFFDLDTGNVTSLTTHGMQVRTLALDSEGTVAVTGDPDGIIRVGPVTGEEPHLLLGHDGQIYKLAIDPQGRWIASSGKDNTVRLWPMPDLSKPPLHTLPREELIAKLKTLTNLRIVRDEESFTGWNVEAGPFTGWSTVPEW